MALKGPTTNRKEIRSWAESKNIVPVELEPHRVDAEPACMALLDRRTAESTARVMVTNWDDFFEKFEALRLTLVYDEGTAYNEILQVDHSSETAPPAYRKIAPN